MFLPGQAWSATGMNAEQSGQLQRDLGIVTAVGALEWGYRRVARDARLSAGGPPRDSRGGVRGSSRARGAGADVSGFVGVWTFQGGSQVQAVCSSLGTVVQQLSGTRVSIYPGTTSDLVFDIGCRCTIGSRRRRFARDPGGSAVLPGHSPRPATVGRDQRAHARPVGRWRPHRDVVRGRAVSSPAWAMPAAHCLRCPDRERCCAPGPGWSVAVTRRRRSACCPIRRRGRWTVRSARAPRISGSACTMRISRRAATPPGLAGRANGCSPDDARPRSPGLHVEQHHDPHFLSRRRCDVQIT